MDVIDYLWNSTGEGGAKMMAAGLNTPAVRDGLLRHAALTNSWTQLRKFAEAASEVAPAAGWSRSGPDTVAAICQWISADRILRAVPDYDRATRLAGATLGSWSSPGQVAEAIAGTAPVGDDARRAFTDALTADGRPGAGREVISELEDAMNPDVDQDDPDLVAFACNNPPVRQALLRDAARTGQWGDLVDAADVAADAARAAGTFDAGPRLVGAIGRWMVGDPAGEQQLRDLRAVDPQVEALLTCDRVDVADRWAHLPALAEDDAQAFTQAATPVAQMTALPGLGGPGVDPLESTSVDAWPLRDAEEPAETWER